MLTYCWNGARLLDQEKTLARKGEVLSLMAIDVALAYWRKTGRCVPLLSLCGKVAVQDLNVAL